MRPTRRTQPYRRGARHPGGVRDAILRGRTLYGYNPADIYRRAMRKGRRRRY